MNLIKITFVIIISFYINLKVYAEPVHKNDYDVSEQVNIPTGVIFNPSGTKMYVTGFTGNSGRVAQYSLSVPYSTSSGVSLDANIITEIEDVLKRPQDIKFNSDGSKVLILSTWLGATSGYSSIFTLPSFNCSIIILSFAFN